MRPPAFWWREAPTLPARLLAPLGRLYGGHVARRMARAGAPGPVPVICVGNVGLGGAGKTPTALALADLLRTLGHRPAFLSRGYGGRLDGVPVEPGRHGAAEVGDEPLLLARAAPTVVARDRPAGAALCAALGADVIVMDDGLQNPSLRKDLALAVFDAGVGIGNGLAFPAGPLRAPLDAHWPLIDAAVIVGEGAAGERIAAQAEARGLLAVRAALRPDPQDAAALAGQPVLAFAGIGRPDKFFDSLRAVGAQVRATRAFPDHHRYRPRDLSALEREASQAGLRLVTTEKDRVKLPPDAAVTTLPVRLVIADDGTLRARLAERLAGRAPLSRAR
jgi:tetraacyldisaccharide 4'-kinase